MKLRPNRLLIRRNICKEGKGFIPSNSYTTEERDEAVHRTGLILMMTTAKEWMPIDEIYNELKDYYDTFPDDIDPNHNEMVISTFLKDLGELIQYEVLECCWSYPVISPVEPDDWRNK